MPVKLSKNVNNSDFAILLNKIMYNTTIPVIQSAINRLMTMIEDLPKNIKAISPKPSDLTKSLTFRYRIDEPSMSITATVWKTNP